MNAPFIESYLNLSQLSANVFTQCTAPIMEALDAAAASPPALPWPAALGRTLDIANSRIREGTSMLGAISRAQRASLHLDTLARTLRTLQQIAAESESEHAELRTRFASDSTKHLCDWLDEAAKARDTSDLMLGSIKHAQDSQNLLKTFWEEYAAVMTRVAGATLHGVRSSLQDPEPQ